jgi:hypothetical protein
MNVVAPCTGSVSTATFAFRHFKDDFAHERNYQSPRFIIGCLADKLSDGRISRKARYRLPVNSDHLIDREKFMAITSERKRRASIYLYIMTAKIVRFIVGCSSWSQNSFAMARALRPALALLIDSSYSPKGVESATRPPPAWRYALPSLSRMVRMAMQESRLPEKPK